MHRTYSRQSCGAMQRIRFRNSNLFSTTMGSTGSKSFSEEIIGFDTIITIEDHILEGGFGSYTLEVSANTN